VIVKKKIGDHRVAQIFSWPRGTFTPKPHAHCPVAARGLITHNVSKTANPCSSEVLHLSLSAIPQIQNFNLLHI
jgi:hypothetical protein